MGSLSRVNPYRHFNDPSSPCFNRCVVPGISSSALPLIFLLFLSLSQIILTLKFVAIQFKTQFLLSNIYTYKDPTLTIKKSGVIQGVVLLFKKF